MEIDFLRWESDRVSLRLLFELWSFKLEILEANALPDTSFDNASQLKSYSGKTLLFF